jgi:hypothetical protein
MKNITTRTIIAVFSFVACFNFNSCSKNADEPEQKCRTCIARDKLEGAPVANGEVCTDAAESNFRDEYSNYNVSCE